MARARRKFRGEQEMVKEERLTMTISEFAKAYGISRHLAYSLARQDRLPVPVIFIGSRRMVVSRAAGMELLTQRKTAEKEG